MSTQILMSISSAAVAMDRSEQKVRQLIRSGELKAKKDGKGYLVSAKQIEEWFETLEDA